jgi:hypothetical protein
MLKYEKDDSQTAPLLQAFAKVVLQKPASPSGGQPQHLFLLQVQHERDRP